LLSDCGPFQNSLQLPARNVRRLCIVDSVSERRRPREQGARITDVLPLKAAIEREESMKSEDFYLRYARRCDLLSQLIAGESNRTVMHEAAESGGSWALQANGREPRIGPPAPSD
jgi:hypothetical protein